MSCWQTQRGGRSIAVPILSLGVRSKVNSLPQQVYSQAGASGVIIEEVG
jgi:hypothetical protein